MDEGSIENPRNRILDEVFKSHHSHFVVIEQRIDAVSHPSDSLLGIIVHTLSLHYFACDFDILSISTLRDSQHHISSTKRTTLL